MAKIQDDEPCPCGSGKTFGECHGKKLRERAALEITGHISLKVIPEPDPNSRTIFEKMPETGTIFLQGYESKEAMECGSCGAPLAVGISREAATSIVFKCAQCGAFNDTIYPDSVGQAIKVTSESSEAASKSDRLYDQRVVFLTDLLDKRKRPPTLEDYTFVGCQVRGPVIVYSMETTFNGCTFQDDIESMLYEVPEGASKVGIVGLIRCTFKDCDISAMGIAGTSATLRLVRAAFGKADPA